MGAIEAFAADVAHEIKNPLTSLRSAVETAALVKNPEQQKKLMSIIQDDVVRLDRLISDISDASRIDAELSQADTERVDMRRIVETFADIYRETGAANGIQFTVEADPADPLTVNGIESRLGQVLTNLVTNAISFSPPTGMIMLRGRREKMKAGVAVIVDRGRGSGARYPREQAGRNLRPLLHRAPQRRKIRDSFRPRPLDLAADRGCPTAAPSKPP